MFVSGPTGTSQTSSMLRHVSTMKLTASVPSSGVLGAGRSAPSRPLSPWTNAAAWGSDTSGRGLPACTGTSMPSRSRDHQRVVGGAIERGVARDRGDPHEFGMSRSRHDRQRVVVTGIAVEQHTWRHPPSMAPTAAPAEAMSFRATCPRDLSARRLIARWWEAAHWGDAWTSQGDRHRRARRGARRVRRRQ